MVNDDVIGVEQHGYTAVYSGAGTAGTAQVLVLQVLDCRYWYCWYVILLVVGVVGVHGCIISHMYTPHFIPPSGT